MFWDINLFSLMSHALIFQSLIMCFLGKSLSRSRSVSHSVCHRVTVSSFSVLQILAVLQDSYWCRSCRSNNSCSSTRCKSWNSWKWKEKSSVYKIHASQTTTFTFIRHYARDKQLIMQISIQVSIQGIVQVIWC